MFKIGVFLHFLKIQFRVFLCKIEKPNYAEISREISSHENFLPLGLRVGLHGAKSSKLKTFRIPPSSNWDSPRSTSIKYLHWRYFTFIRKVALVVLWQYDGISQYSYGETCHLSSKGSYDLILLKIGNDKKASVKKKKLLRYFFQ